MRKLVAILAVLLVAGVGGYFGLRAYAQREAEAQIATVFQNFEANGLKASHGALSLDLIARRLDLADIVLSAADGRSGTTKIGRVTASGFSQPAADRVKATRIEFADIAFDGPSPLAPEVQATYRIPLIAVDDYEGPARIDAASSEPWQLLLSFLSTASARTVSSPGITITTSAGTGDEATTTEVRYGATTFNDIAGGKIATAGIGPSTFALKAPKSAPGTSGTGGIDRIDAKAIDIAATLALLDAERRRSDNTFHTLYESVSAEGYKVSFENGVDQKWARIAVTDVALKPSGFPLEPLVQFGQRVQELQKTGARPSSEEVGQMLVALAGLYDALRIGGITLTEMSATQPGGGTATLAALKVGALADGRIASISMEGLAGKDGGGHAMKLGRLAINGVRPGVIMRVADTVVTDPAAMQTLPVQFATFRMLEGIEIEGAEAAMGSEPDDAVKIDTLHLSWGNFVDDLPSRLAATLRMSGPISVLADQEPFALLAESGATRASLAADVGSNWSEADKTITLSPLFLDVPGAFSGSARLVLGSVGRDAFSTDEAAAMNALAATTIGSIEVTLTDAGLYAMKLKQVAEEQGATPEAVQQLLLGIAQIVVEQVAGDHPDLEPAGKAVLSFLEAPKGKLTVKITPKAALPLLESVQALQTDPMSLLDAVSVEATTTR